MERGGEETEGRESGGGSEGERGTGRDIVRERGALSRAALSQLSLVSRMSYIYGSVPSILGIF